MRALVRVLVCFVVSFWSIAVPAFGQAAPVIDLVKVSLWPDYDKPEMLVLVEAWLDPGSEMPATVTVPMPTTAGAPHAVAKRGADGMLLLAEHLASKEGAWTMVIVKTDQIENRVEYYAPLAMDGEQRSYRFVWPGTPSEIRRIEFEILQPQGVSDVIIEPAATREAFDPDGRRYLLGDLPGLAPRQAMEIEVRYSRLPTEPAVHPPTLAPPSVAPAAVPPAAALAPSAQSTLTWVLAALVLLLSLALVYLYFRPPKRG
ncbi:MAG: hypothetical protein JRI25_27815 [Deltaproteobacteria bacterium]|nr:hypothetical protein [Deltaproteobacteria bacterium]